MAYPRFSSVPRRAVHQPLEEHCGFAPVRCCQVSAFLGVSVGGHEHDVTDLAAAFGPRRYRYVHSQAPEVPVSFAEAVGDAQLAIRGCRTDQLRTVSDVEAALEIIYDIHQEGIEDVPEPGLHLYWGDRCR